jgi:hypothetical protein
MKMEVAHSAETSVHVRNTQYCIPENSKIDTYSSGNVKSCIKNNELEIMRKWPNQRYKTEFMTKDLGTQPNIYVGILGLLALVRNLNLPDTNHEF